MSRINKRSAFAVRVQNVRHNEQQRQCISERFEEVRRGNNNGSEQVPALSALLTVLTRIICRQRAALAARAFNSSQQSK